MAAPDNGVPPLHASLNHESITDPDVESPWEKLHLHISPEKIENLFTITLTGSFVPPMPGPPQEHFENTVAWTSHLHHKSTNSWDIRHNSKNVPQSTISFTMNRYKGFPTLNTTMRLYKAAVELEKLLLVDFLPFAIGPFDIQVKAMKRATFDTHYGSTEADSDDNFTREWLNKDTAGRVYDWITTIVPMYTHAWMSDKTVRELDAYDYTHGVEQTGEHVLTSSNENVLIVVYTRNGSKSGAVVDTTKFVRIESAQTRRHPCKMQTHELDINPARILQRTKLVDLQSLLSQQLLVRKTLLDPITVRPALRKQGRVVCAFPSFDKFPGLKSEGSDDDVTSALHCNPDPPGATPTFFGTFGVTHCSGEELVKFRPDFCRPSGTVFRKRHETGCPILYDQHPDDEKCCEVDFGGPMAITRFVNEMRIFGNKTREHAGDSSGLIKDAYNWFAEQFGLSGEITIYSPDYFRLARLFESYLPNCPELNIEIRSNTVDEAMRTVSLGNEHRLLYDVKYEIHHRPSPEDVVRLLSIRPPNETTIEFSVVGDPPISTVWRLEQWIQTLEHQRINMIFSQEQHTDPDDPTNTTYLPYSIHDKIVGHMVHRNFKIVSTTRVPLVQMRKNHVNLSVETINSNSSDDPVSEISMRFTAGTKYRPGPVRKSHGKKGKRKLVFDSDEDES